MGTDRDRVWAGVLQVANEQAGFSVEEVNRVCEELFGDEAPTEEVIDDAIAVMADWGVLESFGFDSGTTYYMLTDDEITP